MIFLRVCYYLVVIAAATAGLVNTLQLRGQRREIDGQSRRLILIENVRDRIRDHVMRSDEVDSVAQLQVAQLQLMDLQERVAGLELLLDKPQIKEVEP